jgi:structural toxin protein (hemagglutinin/hemolysin) RtxA
MYQIYFYVPVAAAEKVKNALFEKGAGRMGNYSHCSFETLGEGQFLPLEGSRPAIGSHEKLERVEELKVEMVCTDDCIVEVVAALKASHPYETPAYSVIKLVDL